MCSFFQHNCWCRKHNGSVLCYCMSRHIWLRLFNLTTAWIVFSMCGRYEDFSSAYFLLFCLDHTRLICMSRFIWSWLFNLTSAFIVFSISGHIMISQALIIIFSVDNTSLFSFFFLFRVNNSHSMTNYPIA